MCAATNVAGVSITIPCIRFSLCLGLTRKSKFDSKTGVRMLAESIVTHDQAVQRMGRTGRKFAGFGIQMYDDFQW